MKCMRPLSVIAMMLILPAALHAAVPVLIGYQGKLTNNSGQSLSGQYGFVFRLYDAPSGGTKLWAEQQSQVTVDNGLYSVLLGTGTAVEIGNSLSSLPFDNPYWLEVQVNGQILTPRQVLTSSPYAITAAAAAATSGNASRANNLAGGTAGELPYQSAPNTTAMLAVGSANQVLQTRASGQNPGWVYIVNANVDANAAIAISKLATSGTLGPSVIVSSMQAGAYENIRAGTSTIALSLQDGATYYVSRSTFVAGGITTTSATAYRLTVSSSVTTYKITLSSCIVFQDGTILSSAQMGVPAGDYENIRAGTSTVALSLQDNTTYYVGMSTFVAGGINTSSASVYRLTVSTIVYRDGSFGTSAFPEVKVSSLSSEVTLDISTNETDVLTGAVTVVNGKSVKIEASMIYEDSNNPSNVFTFNLKRDGSTLETYYGYTSATTDKRVITFVYVDTAPSAASHTYSISGFVASAGANRQKVTKGTLLIEQVTAY